MENSTGWKSGDQLVLAPTEFNSSGNEVVTIKSIGENGEVKLKEALINFHYGSPKPTAHPIDGIKIISGDFGGSLDMRCGVGHLTRSIRIMGSKEGDLGGHLQIYHWFKELEHETINLRGSV